MLIPSVQRYMYRCVLEILYSVIRVYFSIGSVVRTIHIYYARLEKPWAWCEFELLVCNYSWNRIVLLTPVRKIIYKISCLQMRNNDRSEYCLSVNVLFSSLQTPHVWVEYFRWNIGYVEKYLRIESYH